MRYARVLGVVLLVMGLIAGVAVANGGIHLDWHVIGGGGGTSSGGHYALEATIGQPVSVASSGGAYQLCVGYWCGSYGNVSGWHIYLPHVDKAHR